MIQPTRAEIFRPTELNDLDCIHPVIVWTETWTGNMCLLCLPCPSTGPLVLQAAHDVRYYDVRLCSWRFQPALRGFVDSTSTAFHLSTYRHVLTSRLTEHVFTGLQQSFPSRWVALHFVMYRCLDQLSLAGSVANSTATASNSTFGHPSVIVFGYSRLESASSFCFLSLFLPYFSFLLIDSCRSRFRGEPCSGPTWTTPLCWLHAPNRERINE